ncbi:MAG: undecaprenyl-diphosphate phosphatase [Bdellovibrionales bacterium]|nr:undecaprenyl-diphosphate phosphatase [Bdellovibrionales bacterium]
MGFFEAILYGFVQGATEYLPVSSSAHLLLLPRFLGKSDPGLAFDVILHLGTLLATAVYFFRDWLVILMNPLPSSGKKRVSHLSWVHLVVGTLPAVLAGVFFNSWIKENTRAISILWFTLPAFGVLLWWVDKRCPKERKLGEARIRDVFLVGCMQCFALIPGVSRSGSTITASRLLGFTRADSARISFLLSLPITLGAVVYEARNWEEVAASVQGIEPLVLGCLSALLFGALAIHFLIKWVSKSGFAAFAVYRVILAALIFFLL